MNREIAGGFRLLPYVLLLGPIALVYDLYYRLRYGVWIHRPVDEAVREVSDA